MPYGNSSEVGICFQDSYGTSNINSMHWIPIVDEDIALEKPNLVSQSMTGLYDEGQNYEGPNVINGTLNCEAHPIASGAIMKAMFGDPTTVASGTPTVYRHTFKPRTDEFDGKSANVPFTMYKAFDDPGSATLLYDLNGGSFELSINNGELLMHKLGVVGGKFSQVAQIAASFPTGKQWTWDQTSMSLDGTATDLISSLTVTVEEPIESKHTLNNSVYPSRNKRTGFRMINISGTLTFDDQTEYQEFLAQTERKLVTTFKGEGVNFFEMTIPLFRHTDFKPVIGGPGEIEISFTSKGVYSVGSGTAIEFVLVNTKAGY